ncbi:hypothetical protein NE619_11665 [Anaerovorax odorimutans]|uniref:Uncharacterized protein n=1 Tax=Anaerovorax odorimutans TaxID=109327 RepID=A0ABT1RQA8_9FIRM|nr:hypothetical protein [Anaerovorax odorimutans]
MKIAICLLGNSSSETRFIHKEAVPVTNPDFFEKLRIFQGFCGLQNGRQHKFSFPPISNCRKPTTLRNFALFFRKVTAGLKRITYSTQLTSDSLPWNRTIPVGGK